MAKTKDANYNHKAKEPARNMGQGQHANLPQQAISRPFGGPVYRDGLVNSFVASLEDISQVDENGCR